LVRAPAVYFSILAAISATVVLRADAPGKRRGIELESSRTFSSEIVRDLQSPDRVRAARAARAGFGRKINARRRP
jgi:hypothetical protein